ncbi:MAG: hypothetical protein ABL996_07895 [Micropepsaceae bacterium]
MMGQGYTNWLWAVLGVGVVALFAAYLPSPMQSLSVFDAPEAIEVAKPGVLKMREMPPQSTFAEIVARPIFNEGRRADPATRGAGTLQASAFEGQGDLSEFRLVGIVADATTQRAIVERPGAGTLTVGPGDRIGGWRVDKIDAHGVTASKDSQSVRLVIPKSRPRAVTP